MVERAEVREEKRKFLAEAKIAFLDEFEVRAQIDAAAHAGAADLCSHGNQLLRCVAATD